MKGVSYWWGNRPFWCGEDRATPDFPVVAAFWGMMKLSAILGAGEHRKGKEFKCIYVSKHDSILIFISF